MSSSSRSDSAEDLGTLLQGLAASEAAQVEDAIKGLSLRLEILSEADYRLAVDALCSLFYVDKADRPDLERAMNQTTDLLAGQGARVVPLLLRRMKESDLKSHLHLARVLGRIGLYALDPLRDVLATSDDPYSRSFALYALGKMTCPEVARALPEILGGLMHPDREVQDSAARTVGRIVQVVPAEDLTPVCRQQMFESLLRASRHHQAPVRAKAIRSLGKMAAAGLLEPPQLDGLSDLLHGALGESEEHQWDRAYIVRKEAQAALSILES